MTNDVIIVGKDCEKCKYCTLVNEENVRDIGVCCAAKNNTYYHWGACITCDLKDIKK